MLIIISISPDVEQTLNALLYPMESKKVSHRNKQVLLKMTPKVNLIISYIAETHKISKASAFEALIKKFSSYYTAGKVSDETKKEIFNNLQAVIEQINAVGVKRSDRNHNVVGANKRTLSVAIVDYMTQSISIA
jgi:hypothetical protein